MCTTFSKECSVNLVKVFFSPDNSNLPEIMNQGVLIIEEPIEDRILANYSIKKLFSIFRNQYQF